MPCNYSEHVIACGTDGGFTVTGRKPQTCQRHRWEPHWHMGYIIGRECTACGRQKHMPREWCEEAERAAAK